MDVFELRQRLVDDYASYTRSFINIADPVIQQKVDSALAAGAFWPEPLLQLNPTFRAGGTIDDLVSEGSLHPECARIFRIDKSDQDHTGKQLLLHTHQTEAIRKAKEGRSYVLTSGTGSRSLGNSLSRDIQRVSLPFVLRATPARKKASNVTRSAAIRRTFCSPTT